MCYPDAVSKTVWEVGAMKTRDVPVATDTLGRPPLCPHCGAELIAIRDHLSTLGWLSNVHVFSCPACRKVLGATATAK
jgi:predicted RNA-binding Zn-ribbon protein involved in translation (DUF1610 family)